MLTNGKLINYFVCRTVADGLPAGDFKSMNKYLYDCGHIQNTQIGTSISRVSVKVKRLLELKKDRVYKVHVLMSLDTSWEIMTDQTQIVSMLVSLVMDWYNFANLDNSPTS
jgi:hypothetical protein